METDGEQEKKSFVATEYIDHEIVISSHRVSIFDIATSDMDAQAAALARG